MMVPSLSMIRLRLRECIRDAEAQGHLTTGCVDELERIGDSYDDLIAFARRLSLLPLRPDWPWVEPEDEAGTFAACDPTRPLGAIGALSDTDAADRIEAAWHGRIAGCILGKPLEVNPSLAELERAFRSVGDWPPTGYVKEAVLEALGRRHGSWTECVAGRIGHVCHDDDLNYALLGLMVLEQHGITFTSADLRRMWLNNLPILTTFGPERAVLTKAAIASFEWRSEADTREWTTVDNPLSERCGALIRVDAYAWAAIGRPELAARLAWRDAAFTHRRTGVYASMAVAAALAAAPVVDDPVELWRLAARYVPQRSRLHATLMQAIDTVAAADDWFTAASRITARYGSTGTHCLVHQEMESLVATTRFARDTGHGIGLQVAAGNDTDSFGATAGSLLGLRFGPGGLDRRWLEPFGDRLHHALARFDDHTISACTARLRRLPAIAARDLAAGKAGPVDAGPVAQQDAGDGAAR